MLRPHFLVIATALLLAGSVVQADPSATAGEKSRNISTRLNEKGVELASAGNNVQAEATLRQALEADPGNITAAVNLAGVYIANKKQNVAIELVKKLVEDGVQDPGLYARLGDAYFSIKDVAKAVEAYQQARKIGKARPESAVSGVAEKLGVLYAMEQRLDEAEEVLLEAIEENPKAWHIVSNLSNIFLANGKPEKAVSSAKRALQIKASSSLYVTLGNAYEMLSDHKNSLISYRRAVDLGDKREELQARIEKLEKFSS